MARILDADWTTRPRTAFRRPTPAVHPALAIPLGLHRFLACPYRFLAGKRVEKAALSSGPSPNKTAFDPSPLCNFRMSHTTQPPDRSNSYKQTSCHNHGNHNECQQVTTAPARCPRSRTRHAHTRGTKGGNILLFLHARLPTADLGNRVEKTLPPASLGGRELFHWLALFVSLLFADGGKEGGRNEGGAHVMSAPDVNGTPR